MAMFAGRRWDDTGTGVLVDSRYTYKKGRRVIMGCVAIL
jgi:hypothetical protein